MAIININDKEYRLRLTTKGCVDIESKLGVNPLNVFMEVSENKLPKISDLMIIFHGCLQPLQHGISLSDAYDLYDTYCAEGGNLLSFIETIVKCFTESGFIPDKEAERKN